jgi:hypothetical protein
MELDEFEVLKGQTGTRDHGVSVAGTGMCRGTRKVSTAVATCGENGFVGAETVDCPVFLV